MFSHFKPVEKKLEAPHFLVQLNFMHGDAVGYTDSVSKFETEEDVIGFLRVADAIRELDEFNPSFSDLAEVLDISKGEAVELYYDILPRDIACDDFRARLHECPTIFYVDAQGLRTELIKI